MNLLLFDSGFAQLAKKRAKLVALHAEKKRTNSKTIFSNTKGCNREIEHLYSTSQLSNITRKTNSSEQKTIAHILRKDKHLSLK